MHNDSEDIEMTWVVAEEAAENGKIWRCVAQRATGTGRSKV